MTTFDVTRVVSLLPSATEIVAALGAMDSLVGITHECDHPPEVASRARVTSSMVDGAAPAGVVDTQVRTLASAGSPLYTLDEQRIRALRPGLILTQALCDVCAVMETDVRALAQTLTPEPRVVSLSASTLDGVFDDIAAVAHAMALDAEGAALLGRMRARLLAVHDTLKSARAPRPRVAMLEWGDPVFAAGHWVPEMIRRAGGIDALANPGDNSRVIAPAAVAAARPDIVIVAPCGYGVERAAQEARRLLALEAWELPAAHSVWALDGNALTSRPGPGVVDGVEVLARIFNPSLFDPADPSHAICVRDGVPAPTAG